MKKIFALIILALSFSSFADSTLEDYVVLKSCGGSVELRSHIDQGEEKFALQFRGITACSNVILSSGRDYKLTDKNGTFIDKNITLSKEAISAAKSRGGLGLFLKSNKGSHNEEILIRIRREAPTRSQEPRRTQDPAPTRTYDPAPEQDYNAVVW